MSESGFWDDRLAAQDAAKELARLKGQVEYWQKLEGDLRDLEELATPSQSPPQLRGRGGSVKIVPIPGPNAAITALSVSGFPADKFVFLGFPPHKKGRRTFFKMIGQVEETVVFYESKHRILKALKELMELSMLNSRPIMVARELTKQFETIYRGTVDEVLEQLNKTKVLGEFVVVIKNKKINKYDTGTTR